MGGAEWAMALGLGAMLLGSAAAAVLWALWRIAVEDLAMRIVARKNLLTLLLARVLLAFWSWAAMLWCEGSAWGECSASALALAKRFDFESLVESALVALVVIAILILLAYVVTRIKGVVALGGGDVGLYAVLMLYVSPVGVCVLLLASSLMGALVALWYAVRHSEASFPFAPSICLAFLLALFVA